MFDELGDGSIRQDGLRSKPRGDNPGDNIRRVHYPVIGQVVDIYYVDDKGNRDGETILCDLHITSLGIDLERVPFALPRASHDNYISFLPNPATKNLDEKKTAFQKNKIDPAITDADSVIVVFIEGIIHNPVIIGMMPHNQSGFEGVCPSPRGFSDDGDQLKIRMNGTNFIIDKDGNVNWENTNTVDDKIPKKKKFTITLNEKDKDGNPLDQKCEMEIDNTDKGKFCIRVVKANGKLQEFCLDADANKVTLKTTTDDDKINSIDIDPTGIQLNVAKGDLTETVDGARVVNTKDQTFNITGDFTVTASKNIILTPTKKFTVAATEDASITSSAKAKFAGDGGTDVGSGAAPTNVLGSAVKLAGGGSPVARLGDMVVGTGNLGAPVVSNIAQGSPKVSAG